MSLTDLAGLLKKAYLRRSAEPLRYQQSLQDHRQAGEVVGVLIEWEKSYM